MKNTFAIHRAKVADRVSNPQAVDRLRTAHNPDIDRLRHGQAGGIPVGRQGIGGD